ncbi:YicC/YloC family endoribonuclease [Chenggangzhangella methanolivorans]|uniref:YicC family protein n=1 Tax=Chenggangzhangella methanolivorans TaxID=1437009 RepID=A0A9E6R9B8_9HYPH|nr:YicC/YloC family endoribonuclease [Chenggangzhangella methanolivorans]QZN99699.1 YicC family protein [Chenggangzhangella methanolivorans]
MPLASMTGFARASGALGRARWVWELRSVNAKGLDVRLRVPPHCDEVEQAARAAAQARLKRGSVQATLTLERPQSETEVRVNEAALAAVLAAAEAIAARVPGAGSPSVDAILAQRGVVEFVEAEETADERAAVAGAVIADFSGALEDLAAARAREGAALEAVLAERLAAIEDLTARADACPARTPEAVRKRLAEQVEALVGTGVGLDPDRLHQEAALLATRADVREEIDRLAAHVEAARALIAEGGAVGRRLDFLAQEFGRESNTLCAKSNDRGLTAIGLELKAVVEQFREQVQNVE